jgi:hypothetical protein
MSLMMAMMMDACSKHTWGTVVFFLCWSTILGFLRESPASQVNSCPTMKVFASNPDHYACARNKELLGVPHVKS